MNTYNLDSISALRAFDSEVSDGLSVYVSGYYTPGDGGGGHFYWDSTEPIAHDDGGTIIASTSGTLVGCWKRIYTDMVDVKWFGAQGGDCENDQAAIESALHNHDMVYFSYTRKPYLVTCSLGLRRNHVLVGPGKELPGKKCPDNECPVKEFFDKECSGKNCPTIVGIGTCTTVFTTNSLGIIGDKKKVIIFAIFILAHIGLYRLALLLIKPNPTRHITFRDLYIKSYNYPAIDLRRSPNFSIVRCKLSSKKEKKDINNSFSTLQVRLSPRGLITDSRIGYSGDGWAISLHDNCNGTSLYHNVVTGGQAGNCIDISQSQCVDIQGTIMETCGGYGIRIGGDNLDKRNRGNCYSVNICNNYFEKIQKPISLGKRSSIVNANITCNYINNHHLKTAAYGIELGKIKNSTISNNYYRGKGSDSDYFIMFAEPGLSNNKIINSEILNNYTRDLNKFGKEYTTETLPEPTSIENLFGKNRIQFNNQVPTGFTKQYFSERIYASSGVDTIAIVTKTSTGGIIDSIQLVECMGDLKDLSCTIRIGSTDNTDNFDEIISIDPSTLCFSGYHYIKLPLTEKNDKKDIILPAGEDLLLIVIGGKGTGSFRVKVTYRN